MENFKHEIHDNIIELLSSALYDYPVYALREYIQNSYDSINSNFEGEIHIETDDSNQTITIFDNGIEYDSVNDFESNFRNFAVSEKKEKTLIGHKGIGIIAFMSKAEKIVFNAKIKEKTEMLIFEYSSESKNLQVTRDTKSGVELFDKYSSSFCVQIIKLNSKVYNNINYESFIDNRVYCLSHILPISYEGFTNDILHLNDKVNIYLNNSLLKKLMPKSVFGDEYVEFSFVNENDKTVLAKGIISYLGGMKISENTYSNKTNRKELFCGLSIRKKGMFISDGSRLQKKLDDAVLNAFYVELNIEDEFLIENTARTWFESSENLERIEECIRQLYEYLERIRQIQSKLYNDKVSYQNYCDEMRDAKKCAKQHFIVGELIPTVDESEVMTKNREESMRELVEKVESLHEDGIGIFPDMQINLYSELGIKDADKHYLTFSVDEACEYAEIDQYGNLRITNDIIFNEESNFQIHFQIDGLPEDNSSFDSDVIEIRSIPSTMENHIPNAENNNNLLNAGIQYYINAINITLNNCNSENEFLSSYQNFICNFRGGNSSEHYYTEANITDSLLNNLLLRVHVEAMLRYFYMMIDQNGMYEAVLELLNTSSLYDDEKMCNKNLDRWIEKAKNVSQSFNHWQALRDCFQIIGCEEYATKKVTNDFSKLANKVIHAQVLLSSDDLEHFKPLIQMLTSGIDRYING